MNNKYKEEIEINTTSLRNPNVQKQFKDYYFDKDKEKSKVIAPTRATISSSNEEKKQ